jgi:hypothetical protein
MRIERRTSIYVEANERIFLTFSWQHAEYQIVISDVLKWQRFATIDIIGFCRYIIYICCNLLCVMCHMYNSEP